MGGKDSVGGDVMDEYSYPLHMLGTAIPTAPDDEGPDVVALLHEVIAEITGKPVEPPTKPRMGFLP